MKVLVSVASRHGASFEIAEEISATLAAAGFETAVLPPDAVTSLEGYDAVILGSSVYVGHWMDAAVNLVERFSKEITAVPVWLFSSGPMGHEPKPEDEPADIAQLVAATGAREHRVFAGPGRPEPARPRREGPPDRGPGSRRRLPALGRDPGLGLRDRGSR